MKSTEKLIRETEEKLKEVTIALATLKMRVRFEALHDEPEPTPVPEKERGTVWQTKNGKIGVRGTSGRCWWLLRFSDNDEWHDTASQVLCNDLNESTTCLGTFAQWARREYGRVTREEVTKATRIFSEDTQGAIEPIAKFISANINAQRELK